MLWLHLLYHWIINLLTRPKKYKTFRKPQIKTILRNNKKPKWVIDKIIYFKAIMPDVSGYKIADIFNRKFQDKETVSKSFVYDIIKNTNMPFWQNVLTLRIRSLIQ